jgi:hypothetical protein
VNKKVDGQRKRKREKKHKGERIQRIQMERSRGKKRIKKGRATGGIITGVKMEIKEKR